MFHMLIVINIQKIQINLDDDVPSETITKYA